MAINIMIGDTFIDCDTTIEALEMLRGLGIAAKVPLPKVDLPAPEKPHDASAEPTFQSIEKRAQKAASATHRELNRSAPRIAEVTDKATPESKPDVIRAALQKLGAPTTAEISAETGLSGNFVSSILSAGVRRGEVTRSPEGRWSFTPEE